MHSFICQKNTYHATFGAKSIGEVVINTPLPAVADAIYHATHKRFYELPITREQIAMAVEKLVTGGLRQEMQCRSLYKHTVCFIFSLWQHRTIPA